MLRYVDEDQGALSAIEKPPGTFGPRWSSCMIVQTKLSLTFFLRRPFATSDTRGVRKLSLKCLFAGRNNNNKFDLLSSPGN